jgi:hypothetical protein
MVYKLNKQYIHYLLGQNKEKLDLNDMVDCIKKQLIRDIGEDAYNKLLKSYNARSKHNREAGDDYNSRYANLYAHMVNVLEGIYNRLDLFRKIKSGEHPEDYACVSSDIQLNAFIRIINSEMNDMRDCNYSLYKQEMIICLKNGGN